MCILDDAIDQAFNKGDIRNRADLRIYIKGAEVQANHLNTNAGASNFELVTGQAPRTYLDDITTQGTNSMQAPERCAIMDQLFIDKVKNATSALVDNRTMEKDERSRTNALNRDVQVTNARYTEFNFRAGDRVSLEGKSYIMLTDPKTDPIGPGPVLVSEEFNTEKTKKVMYDQLKAPGDQRKVHRITREQPVAKGDFVFAQIDSIVKAGVVTEVNNLIQIHEYLESPAMHSWLPAWETPTG